MTEWMANSMEWLLDFSNILNASIAASWMVLAVIVLRLLLKKAPRWFHVALWGLVAVRLLLPFSIESAFSLIPSAETVPQEILRVEGTQLQQPAHFDVVSNPMFSGGASVEVGQTIDRVQVQMVNLSFIWLVGIAVLLIYTAVSYWCLRRKVSEAVILRDNIFQSENVVSPFVLGIVKPRIYLPYNMGEQDLAHVVAHEQAHIRRRDHWWKPLGFLLLTIHWFNPLMWLAYVLLCRDIELACDEKVIKDLGNEQRADYTQALVACSVNRRMIAACPLAFGEVGVKARVKSVMNYKKPAFWIIVLAVIACVIVAVCFLTNPKDDELDALPLLHSHSYGVVEVTYETSGTNFSMVAQQNTPVYAITDAMQLMSKGEHSSDDEWTVLGTLAETELTKENFDELFFSKGNWFGEETASTIRKNTANAWALIYNQDVLYYVLQQKNGEIYLAYGYYDYLEKDDPGSDDTNIRWLFKLAYDLTEDTGFVATSGENVIPVVVFPAGTPLADVKDSVRWLDIAPGPDDTVPFTILCDGKEQHGWYSVYDAETMESLDFMHPSGLAPQTYLFQNAEYEHDYIVTLQSEEGDLLCFGARIGDATDPAPLVTKWFDYLDNPSGMEGGLTTELPEYPDVTFQYTENQIIASKPFNNSDLTGHVILIGGMPIWNAYFTDLTGDGYPDICATYTYGSGMIDSRIVICDYANGASYELSDRGYHDFTLWLNENDGQLYVDKRVYPNGELISSGRLVYEDDCIQIIETEMTTVSITDIEDPTKAEGFSYDTAMEKFFEDETNEYYFGGIYSQYVIVHYADGTQEDIVSALNAGRATIADLDRFGIRYTVDSKELETAFEANFGGNTSFGQKMELTADYPYWCIEIENTGNGTIQMELQGEVYRVEAGTTKAFYADEKWEAGTYTVSFSTAGYQPMQGRVICTRSSVPMTDGQTTSEATVKHDLTAGDLEVPVEDLVNYVFYTNSTQISVTVKGDDFDGQVNLLDVSQNNAHILQAKVNTRDDDCLFTGLTSARLYRVDCEGLNGCTVVISGDK